MKVCLQEVLLHMFRDMISSSDSTQWLRYIVGNVGAISTWNRNGNICGSAVSIFIIVAYIIQNAFWPLSDITGGVLGSHKMLHTTYLTPKDM